MNRKQELTLWINTEKHTISNPKSYTTILEYIRSIGLTGTKLVCGEGGCGACTVVIANYNTNTKEVQYLSSNGCLTPLCSLDGKQIITIEGIGTPEQLHIVQEKIANYHGSQCGFCTPGIVMATFATLKSCDSGEMEVKDIEDGLDGNLCRCTGYRPILDGFKTLAKDNHVSSNMVDRCPLSRYDPNKDIEFPKELKIYNENSQDVVLEFINEGYRWYQPYNVAQLLELKSQYPNSKIIAGNSEIGVEVHLQKSDFKVYINAQNISTLKQINFDVKDGIEIGVNITLSDLKNQLQMRFNQASKGKNIFKALLDNLKYFAGTQIRNFATLVGNIVTASPISDINPVLIAVKSTLKVKSLRGERKVKMEDLYTGYRTTCLEKDEIVVSIFIPYNDNAYIKAFKMTKRREDDIAIVNSCFYTLLNDENRIEEMRLVYGGMAPTTVYLIGLQPRLKGLNFMDEKTKDKIQDLVLQELQLSFDAPGGMPSYRRTLAISFIEKYWYKIMEQLSCNTNDRITSSIDEIKRGTTSGSQDFSLDFNKDDRKGNVVPHLSAIKQATGVAKYLDDIPKQHGELFAKLITSTKVHALILNVDPSEALKMDGVYHYFDHQDVPGSNFWGVIRPEEEIFASKEVFHFGQIIGVLLAKDKRTGKMASQLVKIQYQELPFILDIPNAIKQKSFFDIERNIKFGHPESMFLDANIGISDTLSAFEGETSAPAQEHFYFEPQGSLAIPKGEDQELEIISSSQNPTEAQREIAKALGILQNRIVVKTKRLGGGFGGKETRSTILAMIVSIASFRSKKPVRLILDRDEDMAFSGQRHPFLAKWKVLIDKDLKIQGLDVDLFSNAGFSIDLSLGVLDRAIWHLDNAYFIPNVKIRGRLCKTNIFSNTAFRGFGGPQGMLIIETIINTIALKLGVDQNVIREKNFYKDGQITHYNNEISDWHVPEMWRSLQSTFEYHMKQEQTKRFNSEHKYKKRGIAMIPTKFGISFGVPHLNQAACLIHILIDGSILLSHGGVEMGQGLHTKMQQICALELGVSLDMVHILETATDKVANSSATAASASSDLNGMAVLDACKILNQRLEPYRHLGDMKSIASKAYMDRVNLSANGFYKTPGLNYNWDTNSGLVFPYFTTGVSASLIELDTLTGYHTVLESKIVMDLGNPINSAIDIGQIEGAFMQGLGWLTTEETLFSPQNGRLITQGPGNYKIPTFHCIPQSLIVELLKGKQYKKLNTIYSSKGVGEPPLFLASSVYFAIWDAVQQANLEFEVPRSLTLYPPATPEIIRLACNDELVCKSTVNALGDQVGWSQRP